MNQNELRQLRDDVYEVWPGCDEEPTVLPSALARRVLDALDKLSQSTSVTTSSTALSGRVTFR